MPRLALPSLLVPLILLGAFCALTPFASASDAPTAHATIHRFANQGVFLLAAPAGYDCVDVHTHAAVSSGATLSSPDPGISCVPSGSPLPEDCAEVDAGGYHAAAGAGVLTVTSACGPLSATQPLALPFSDPGYSAFVTGNGVTPWTCVANESGLVGAGSADYWVFCDVNVHGSPPPPNGGCNAIQSIHTYGGPAGRPPFLAKVSEAPGTTPVSVADSNVQDCNGDGTPGDFDGDYDVGDAGGFFGSSDQWDAADGCGYGLNVHSTSGIASDITGFAVAGAFGVDDTAGPVVIADPTTGATISCQVDGAITPSTDSNDCLSAWATIWGPGACYTHGGDDGYWLFLQAPFSAGTLAADS